MSVEILTTSVNPSTPPSTIAGAWEKFCAGVAAGHDDDVWGPPDDLVWNSPVESTADAVIKLWRMIMLHGMRGTERAIVQGQFADLVANRVDLPGEAQPLLDVILFLDPKLTAAKLSQAVAA